MRIQALWVASMMLVGGLVGLRRTWRHQAIRSGGTLVALALAYRQHPRVVPHIRLIWPTLGSAARPVALLYLLGTIYGFAHAIASLYALRRTAPTSRRWLSGLIGAAEVGAIAVLSIAALSHV
jgi:hypothetical protein